MNESHNDGNVRRSFYREFTPRSKISKDMSINEDFAFSRKMSQNIELADKSTQKNLRLGEGYTSNSNEKKDSSSEEMSRPKSADNKSGIVAIHKFSTNISVKVNESSNTQLAGHDTKDCSDIVIKKKSLSSATEKPCLGKNEPLFNDQGSSQFQSNSSDKLSMTRRNSDRYQQYDKLCHVDSSCGNSNSEADTNKGGQELQRIHPLSQGLTIEPNSDNSASLQQSGSDSLNVDHNSDCKSVKEAPFGKVLFTFNNSDFAKKDLNFPSNHNSCESLKARLSENAPKPSQFSNNSKENSSRLSLQDVDGHDTPPIELNTQSPSLKLQDGQPSQIKTELIESISDFNKVTENIKSNLTIKEMMAMQPAESEMIPKKDTASLMPELIILNEDSIAGVKQTTQTKSDDKTLKPDLRTNQGNFFRIVNDEQSSQNVLRIIHQKQPETNEEVLQKKFGDLDFSKLNGTSDHNKANSLLSKPSRTLDQSNNYPTVNLSDQKQFVNESEKKDMEFHDSDFTSSNFYKTPSHANRSKEDLIQNSPVKNRDQTSTPVETIMLRERLSNMDKLISSSISLELGIVSIDKDKCNKIIEHYQRFQKELQDNAHATGTHPIAEDLDESKSKSCTKSENKLSDDPAHNPSNRGISFSKLEGFENRDLDPSHERGSRMNIPSINEMPNDDGDLEFIVLDKADIHVSNQTPEFNHSKTSEIQKLLAMRFQDLKLGKALFKTSGSDPDSDLSNKDLVSRTFNCDLELRRKFGDSNSIESQKQGRDKSERTSNSESFTEPNFSIHDPDEMTDRDQNITRKSLSNERLNFKKPESSAKNTQESSPIEESQPQGSMVYKLHIKPTAPIISDYAQTYEPRMPKPSIMRNDHLELKKSFGENLKMQISTKPNDSSRKEIKTPGNSEAKNREAKVIADAEVLIMNPGKPNRNAITRQNQRKESFETSNVREMTSEKKRLLVETPGKLLHSMLPSEDIGSKSESKFIEHELLSQNNDTNRNSIIPGVANRHFDLLSAIQDKTDNSILNSCTFSIPSETNIKVKENARDVSPKAIKSTRPDLPKINEQSSESEAINSGVASSHLKGETVSNPSKRELQSMRNVQSTKRIESMEGMTKDFDKKPPRRSTPVDSSLQSKTYEYEIDRERFNQTGSEDRSGGLDPTFNSNDKSEMTAKLKGFAELITKIQGNSFGFDPVSSNKNYNPDSDREILLDEKAENQIEFEKFDPLSLNCQQSPADRENKLRSEPSSQTQNPLHYLKVSPILNTNDTPLIFKGQHQVEVQKFNDNGSPTSNDNYLYICKTELKDGTLDFRCATSNHQKDSRGSQILNVRLVKDKELDRNRKLSADIPISEMSDNRTHSFDNRHKTEYSGNQLIVITNEGFDEKTPEYLTGKNGQPYPRIMDRVIVSNSENNSSCDLSDTFGEQKFEKQLGLDEVAAKLGKNVSKQCSIESLNEANLKILMKGHPPIHNQPSKEPSLDKSVSQRKLLQPFVDCAKKLSYSRPSSNKLRQMQQQLRNVPPRKVSFDAIPQKLQRSRTQERSVESMRHYSNPKPKQGSILQVEHHDLNFTDRQKYLQNPSIKPENILKKIEPVGICPRYYYSAKFQPARSPNRYIDLTNKSSKPITTKNNQNNSRSELKSYMDQGSNPIATHKHQPMSHKYKPEEASYKKNWSKVSSNKVTGMRSYHPTPTTTKAQNYTSGMIYPYILNKQLVQVKEKSIDISICQDIEKICPQFKENNDMKTNFNYSHYESAQVASSRHSHGDSSHLHFSKGDTYMFNTELNRKFGRGRHTGR